MKGTRYVLLYFKQDHLQELLKYIQKLKNSFRSVHFK